DRAQLAQIGCRLIRRAHVRLRNDLHERDSGPIEVDIGLARVLIMQALPGILLQVKARNAHGAGSSIWKIDENGAAADDRLLVLRDLVTRGQIGVEIVFAIEYGTAIDAGIQAEPRPYGLLDAETIDHRQHPGEARIDEAHLRVRFCAKWRGS